MLLDTDPTADPGRPHDREYDRTSELIATLREQLQAERQAHAEARRIIAGLVERIPALEAPTDAPQAPDTATDEPDTATVRYGKGRSADRPTASLVAQDVHALEEFSNGHHRSDN